MIDNKWWRGLALAAVFALGWAGITLFLWDPESRGMVVFLITLAGAHLATTAWIVNAHRVPEPAPRPSEGEIFLRATAHRHLHITE